MQRAANHGRDGAPDIRFEADPLLVAAAVREQRRGLQIGADESSGYRPSPPPLDPDRCGGAGVGGGLDVVAERLVRVGTY